MRSVYEIVALGHYVCVTYTMQELLNFLRFLGVNWPELLKLTREHVFLVFVSTGAAILLGVPLGVLLTRVKALRTPVLGFANVMQTVPSLALFGLLIPIPFIGGIGAPERRTLQY